MDEGRFSVGKVVFRIADRLVVLLVVLVSLASPVSAQREDDRELVIRSLQFRGNRAIDDFTLATSIATSNSAFFARFPLLRWLGLGAKRYFDETDFRRDVLRITALYRRSGFREVTVDTLVQRIGADIHLRFVIDEGEPVRVTSLAVSGVDDVVRRGGLTRDLPLRVGDPFNMLLLQASADTLRSRLRDRGYPFPDVYLNFDARVQNHTAAVHFVVAPGSRATIGTIQVEGAQKVAEDVVRRWLEVQPGDLFSERALVESQLDLYRTRMFNVVRVGLPDSLPLTTADTVVDVLVRVAEGPFHRLRVGLGYGTVDCFRTLTSWTLHDFLGGGRTLDLSARLSKIGSGNPLDANFARNICRELRDEDPERLDLNYNLTATLREPFFLSGRTRAAFSVTAERFSEFQAYLRESYGGEVALTWESPVRLPLTLSYGLSTTRTAAEPAIFCTFLNVCRVEDARVFSEDFRRRSVIGLLGVWDRANSPLDPTRGFRLSGEVRYASEFIGSDDLIQFTRGVVEIASYHRVARRSVFAWRVRLGAVHSPPLADGTGESDRFVPPEDRFYGGGPNSVRGFGQNELGPLVRVLERSLDTLSANGVDTTVADSVIRPSATGGNRLVFANAELRFPLPGFGGRVFGAAFVDAGQVFAEGEALEPSDLRVTPGVGLRFATVIGPMRFDLAYNPYDVTVGRLYQQQENGEPGCRPGSAETCELVVLVERYPERQPERGFLDRLQLHFSVGQAF